MINAEMTFSDILSVVRRRIIWIIVPAVILPFAAYGISILLPARYTSQTTVLVEQQRVPANFVTPVVTDELNMRLATMQEQILSRTRLQPLIERFGLYKEDVGRVPMEDLIDRLRRAIDVTTIRAGGSGIPGFTISFTANNPRLAQQVCAEITSMFIEENLKVREQRAQGTTDFLTNQLDEAKRKLDEQDSKLAAFEQTYMGQLPSQMQSNVQMLSTLNSQLEAVTQTLARAQQDKVYLESQLGQQLEAWKAAQKSNINPRDVEQQIATLQAQLTSLRSRYTDDHPDVIRTREQLDKLKKRLDSPSAAGNGDVVRAATEPKEITQSRNQLQYLKDSIVQKTKQQEELQAQISRYQARLQMTPKVNEEYKALTRDHETALQFYNQLLSKRTESEMATDLERRQEGEQFRVMDPANLPERPTFPNRRMFAGVGGVLGLALGVGIAFLLEFLDSSIRTEGDVQKVLQVPVLIAIPFVDVKGAGGNGRRKLPWRIGRKARSEAKAEAQVAGA